MSPSCGSLPAAALAGQSSMSELFDACTLSKVIYAPGPSYRTLLNSPTLFPPFELMFHLAAIRPVTSGVHPLSLSQFYLCPPAACVFNTFHYN
jgi:hypothetical protein